MSQQKPPRLFFLLNQAQHRLRKLADRLSLESLGASAAQIGALYFIRAHDGCLQREIADEFGQDESAVTGMLGRIEQAGLIARRPSDTDSRARIVSITAKGRHTLEAADQFLASFNRRLTKGFDKAETELVARFLQSIVDRIDGESF